MLDRLPPYLFPPTLLLLVAYARVEESTILYDGGALFRLCVLRAALFARRYDKRWTPERVEHERVGS